MVGRLHKLSGQRFDFVLFRVVRVIRGSFLGVHKNSPRNTRNTRNNTSPVVRLAKPKVFRVVRVSFPVLSTSAAYHPIDETPQSI